MNRLVLAVLAVVALLGAAMTLALIAAGCSASSAGASVGCADAGQTFGEQCTTVFTELCKQAARCNMPVSSIDECASTAAAQSCCTGSACDDAGSCQAPAQVSACQADIDNADCNIIVNFTTAGDTPSDCTPFVTSM